MNIILFQMLIPPLIVGGIAGITLSSTGFYKLRELIDNHYSNQNNIVVTPGLSDNVNPVREDLKNANKKYRENLYDWTRTGISCFILSELFVIICVISLIITTLENSCSSNICTTDPYTSICILLAYSLFVVAVCIVGYMYVGMTFTGLNKINEVDNQFVNQLLAYNP